ncbi:366_t:CDS:2, partial [Funneliformis mosseae]
LAIAIYKLGLSFTFTFSYDVKGLSSLAFEFKIQDMETIKVTFREASSKNIIIPNVKVIYFSSKYVLTEINKQLLRLPNFNVNNLKKMSNE